VLFVKRTSKNQQILSTKYERRDTSDIHEYGLAELPANFGEGFVRDDE